MDISSLISSNLQLNIAFSDIIFALFLSLFAGLATGIGSIIAYFIKIPKRSYLSVLLSFSAGVMIYISLVEIFRDSIEKAGFINTNLFFFIGIAVIVLIDILVPHAYASEESGTIPQFEDIKKDGTLICRAEDKECLMRTGIFVAFGIAIHNFPEGMATFISGISGNPSFYITITLAIAIHNIPEGISVSIPIYYATGSRKKAILYSFFSGLAEPLGALIALLVLLPFLSEFLIASLLAFVAGIMVYISLDELLPTARKYGNEHLVLLGILSGMIVMAVSLVFLP